MAVVSKLMIAALLCFSERQLTPTSLACSQTYVEIHCTSNTDNSKPGQSTSCLYRTEKFVFHNF